MPEYFYYKNWVGGYVSVKKDSEKNTRSYQYMQSSTVSSNSGETRTPTEIIKFDAVETHWSYLAENVPAFIEEPYISTINDYLSVVKWVADEIKLLHKNSAEYTPDAL